MKIHIPTPLRSYTGGLATVESGGTTVTAALEALVTEHPAMRQHLFTPEGKLRSFVNLYLNDDDIRYLPAKEDTLAGSADELTIIPSIAGGSALDWRSVLRSKALPERSAAHGSSAALGCPFRPCSRILRLGCHRQRLVRSLT